MDCPFAELGLDDSATPAMVKAAWRSLAKMHHPDCGGDPLIFDRLRKAYGAALELAAQPRRCQRCHGTGRVQRQNGFHSISVICPDCNGIGKIEISGDDQ